MPTGDGLLARLSPTGPLPVAHVVALCDAALEHGNGVIEVTQRGSLQVRGLSGTSAPLFARRVFALAPGTHHTPALLASPLMGLDARELSDLRPVLAELRAGLAAHPVLESLSPKISVLLDGSGKLNLDGVPADLRLCATADSRIHVSLAGDAATAASLTVIEPEHALEVAVQVLTRIAARGTDARARSLANVGDLTDLRRGLARVMDTAPRHITPPHITPPPITPRPTVQPIGTHLLKDGRLALGVALAFGHTEAATLRRWAQFAADYGATSIETAPGRALLAVGLTADASRDLGAAAAALGFIVRPDDPRCFVVACAGAPACASAQLATRPAAPAIVQAAAGLLDGSFTLHVSGCTKGCAHPAVAAMTFVGPGTLVMHGRASDPPHGAISIDRTIAGLAHLAAERRSPAHAAASSAQMLSRLGIGGVLTAMGAA